MNARAPVSCARIRRQLPLLCGNDESAAVTRRAWAHLADCSACRREWRAFHRARTALTAVDPDADGVLPDAFFSTLRDDVIAAAVADAPAVGGPRRRRRVVAGLAAAALVVAGAWLFQPAAPVDLLTRPAIRSTPARGPSGGRIQEISLPLQGLGAQERAVQDLRLLLDDRGGWADRTRELQDLLRRSEGRGQPVHRR